MPQPPRTVRDGFHERVYRLVRAIPPGRVMTYGAIAACLSPPPHLDLAAYARIGPRWVGYAMAACPEDVPWHRVVNARGGISPRIGHGPHVQRALLLEEGVAFEKDGRIDVQRWAWSPDPGWLEREGLSDQWKGRGSS